MKIRLFAVILAVFAFCSVASAQTYFIRAEGRNNLRSCAGFNCRVVETAPVGTVLEVVGEFNRWLKINRNGEEVWMANWIDYTRVDPSQSKHPGVIIEGSAGFTAQMEAALDVLKDRTPHWYDYVDIGLNKIVQRLNVGPGVNVVARTFYLDYGDDPPVRSTAERHTIATAAILVHEACHVHRIQDAGFPYGTNAEIIREERACVEVQLEALEAMDIYNKALGARQWLREIIENIENPEYWWWADDDESCIETDEQTSPPASVDPSQSKHPGVAIEGSAGFIAQMEASLDVLKDRAPQWYDYAISGLDKIVQRLNVGPCVNVGTRTFSLNSGDDPPAESTADWRTIVTASEFVHEACHVHRYEAGINVEAYIEEGSCAEVQLEVIEALDPFDRTGYGSWLRYLIENIENPEYWWWADD